MNKEIAKMNHTEEAIYKIFYCMAVILGFLFLIGWGIPWFSSQKSTVAILLAPVSVVVYTLVVMLMYGKLFRKPKVEIDRTNEPELHETDR